MTGRTWRSCGLSRWAGPIPLVRAAGAVMTGPSGCRAARHRVACRRSPGDGGQDRHEQRDDNNMAGDATAARQVCHRRLAELTAATNARVLDLGSGGGLGRLKPGAIDRLTPRARGCASGCARLPIEPWLSAGRACLPALVAELASSAPRSASGCSIATCRAVRRRPTRATRTPAKPRSPPLRRRVRRSAPTTRVGQVFASIHRREGEQLSSNGRRRLPNLLRRLTSPPTRIDQVAQPAANTNVQRSRRFQSSHHSDAMGITAGPWTHRPRT